MNPISRKECEEWQNIQRRVSPPLSPLELTANIYKNSAGNSIIKYLAGQKKCSGGRPAYFLDIAFHFWQNIPPLCNSIPFEGG